MTRILSLLPGAALLLLSFPPSHSGHGGSQDGDGSHPFSASAAGTNAPVQHGGPDSASAALWAKAQRMYAQNDFAQALAAAEHVTDPLLKRDAQNMIGQIKAYVGDLQDGVAAEAHHDPVAAIKAYAAAVRIKSDGPGDPAGRVVRVQQEAAAAKAPDDKGKSKDAQRQARLAQQRAKAAQAVAKATQQENSGDLQGALASFGQAHAADPANAVAASGLARLTSRLAAPPQAAASAPSPAAAIRSFYAGQYREAEEQLNQIVAAPDAKVKGAAYFYLGATHFYRALLEAHRPLAEAAHQPEVQAAFKQAHALGYVPLPRFVPPVLMQAWQSTS